MTLIRIAALSAWSVAYYESTAVRGHERGGGLSEYYSERDTREPVVIVAGDRTFAEEKMGVTHGGGISQEDVTRWFNEGVSPAGPGVGKARPGTPGWDVLITVPKSVSLQAALCTDSAQAEVIINCVFEAVQEALGGYLFSHAGYTRVTNAEDPSKKDLQRLPALPFVTYFHHTARPLEDGTCDPHMHVHALLPGKVARADGRMVAIDSQSMYHEAKAAGMLFQKSMRDRLSAALGIEWEDVDPHTGVAEIKGYTRETIKAFSRRSSALMDWARANLDTFSNLDTAAAAEAGDHGATDADAAAKEARQRLDWLDSAQKATRHKKLETLHYDELREQWQNDERSAGLDVDAFVRALGADAAKKGPGGPPDAGDVFALLGTLKNNWTRADVAEAVVGLWGPGRGAEVITTADVERIVDGVIEAACFQVVEDRKPWHREGHMRYTDALTLHREAEVMQLCDLTSSHHRLAATPTQFEMAGLQGSAIGAMTELARSPWMINVLEAPAGSGKTTSLKALRTNAEHQGRRVILLSAWRQAVNEARGADAASEYDTIAATRLRITNGTLDWDKNTIVVVDEAATTGDRDLYELLKAVHGAEAKIILVGDSHQLQPVRAGGGMFRDLAENLPRTQAFDRVWRQKDPEEKAITLRMRDAQTHTDVETVAAWYASHDRLFAADAVTAADKVVTDYFEHREQDRDVLVIADKWQTVDPLNLRIQRISNRAYEKVLGEELASVPIARDQHAHFGDIIMTKQNNWELDVAAHPGVKDLTGTPAAVTNADRWQVIDVNQDDGSIRAERLRDRATATLPAEYAREHVVLGYVGTISAAQGVNADVGLALADPATMTKTAAYPALTRGSIDNRLYLAVDIAGKDEHHHSEAEPDEHHYFTEAEARAMFVGVLSRDDREKTTLATAEEALDAIRKGADPQEYKAAFGGIDPHIAHLVDVRQEVRAVRDAEYAQYQERETAFWQSTYRDSAAEEAAERVAEATQEQEREHYRDRGEDLARDIDDGAWEM